MKKTSDRGPGEVAPFPRQLAQLNRTTEDWHTLVGAKLVFALWGAACRWAITRIAPTCCLRQCPNVGWSDLDTSSGKKGTKRAESKENRHSLLADELSAQFSPQYRREWVPQTVTDADGTTVQAKVQTRGGLHPGVPASAAMRQLIQSQLEAEPSATQTQVRDWIRSKVSPLAKEKMDRHYQEVAKTALARGPAGDFLPFFRAILRLGPRLLMNPDINAVVEQWWLELCDDNVGPQVRESAKRNMESLCAALLEVGQGRTKTISPEEREQIVVACERWLPICKTLNKAFKQLWEIADCQGSERCRKEARGRLAEELDISAKDVEAIEWSLRKPSRKGSKKSTPTQAMCHRSSFPYDHAPFKV